MSDTAVTAQTIIDNCVARAKDDNETQWTDAQLLIFLNKAYEYTHKILCLAQSEIVITEGTVTLVADTQEYSLASNLPDFWGISKNGIYISGVSQPLVPSSYDEKVRSAGATTDTRPTGYYITDTDIGFLDIPTDTAVALYGSIVCRYFKRNTPLALSDTMPYKNLFNEPMSSFMDQLALIKAEVSAQEITVLYNALEQATLEIAKLRVPL